jgi:hypothetical protein
MTSQEVLRRRIRPLLVLFVLGLTLSGITALPLEAELRYLGDLLDVDAGVSSGHASGLQIWIKTVRDGLSETYSRYPFMAYGTDWLAFGHLMIAVVFIGAIRDPWRNEWIITFGIISCCAVVPMAMIAGPLRGIPFWWRIVDCSFGVFGLLPLIAVKWYLRRTPFSPESGNELSTGARNHCRSTATTTAVLSPGEERR